MSLSPEHNTYDALMVDVTHRCNMECANCYLPNREIADMDKEKLFDLCRRLPSKTWVRLIGAEPTMREDICELIATIKEMGHRVSLTTNGLKLHREDYVKQLKEAGLRYVLLSMNGADDDEIYKIVDNGKYAQVKVRALNNLVKHGMIPNIGCIVLKNCNEHAVKRLYDMMGGYKMKLKPVLRFRAVAPIGRSMGTQYTYSLDELRAVACSQLGVTQEYIDENTVEVANNFSGVCFEMPNAFIRLISWDGDETNEHRGRVTEDFTIAPFFEHVKENEGGY